MIGRAAEDALISAVRAAARAHILPRYRALSAGDVRSKSRADDLVTGADLAVEQVLSAKMADILPGALVLGEEAAAADAALLDHPAHGDCVIIDPVDGTWNFVNGVSVFGTIVAVTRDGQTVWGLLYDPLMDDWIVAGRGQGVFYVRPGQSPIPCRLSAGGPVRHQLGLFSPALFPRERRAALAARCAERFERTSGLRCSCHEYRLMLQGGAGWSLSPGPMPWDHAAGVLAMIEAGGHAALVEDGAPYSPLRRDGSLLVAADRLAWAEIRGELGLESPAT